MKQRLLVVDHTACRLPQQEPYRLLAQAGFEVLLLVPKRWKEAYGMAEAEFGQAQAGFELRAQDVFFNGRYHRVVFKGLADAVKEFQPDHLFVNAEPENFLAYQALRARDRNCPRASLTLVSWRNIDYSGTGLPYKAAWLHASIQNKLRDAGARLLCYNEDALEIMGGLGFVVAPTRMGVNLDYFSPGNKAVARKKLGLEPKGKIAGFAGRFIEEKGVADLIAAAASIKNLSLLLVGDGPAKQSWIRQAELAGVPLEIRALKHEQMADAFRAMDVLVLPSRSTPAWKEQFGRVLVEAMACGTPTLGSDSGAIPGVIGNAGLAFPEGDARALALALKRLLKRPPRSQAIKRANAYSWKSVAADLAREFPFQPGRLNTVPVQGVGVFGGTRGQFLEGLTKRPCLVFYLNAHVSNLAAESASFRRLFRSADFVLPDGAGVLLSARWNGYALPERLALGDLMEPIAALGKRCFLWGGEPGVAKAAAKKLKGKIVGCADGFQDDEGIQRVLRRIHACRAELVFIGMGSPKQEMLALELRRKLKGVSVVVCGNAFAFTAGIQKRAPVWMQSAHCEWLWRLMLEPRRMAKRYLLGNLRFMGRALWERLGGLP